MNRSLVVCLVAFALGSAAARAGTVYVPLPGLTQAGSASYEAEITIANAAGTTASVNQVLLAVDSDGTQRPFGPAALQVLGNRTSIVKPGAAFRGLLELSGSPNLRYGARLAGKGAAGALGVALPVVTSENVKAAGGSLALQGLTSTSTRSTHLMLANLAKFAAQCTWSLVRADGTALGAATIVNLKPLSSVFRSDVLAGLVDAAGLTDARASVSCNREFFAYALLTDSATGEVAVVEPSGSGESALTVPGAEPECPTGATCLAAKGVVHKPTPALPVGRVSFAAPAGVATRLRLTLDVTVGPWFAADPDGKHLIFWFVINKNQDMPGMLYFRGPDAYTALARHGIANKHADKIKIVKPFQATPGRTYRVVNDYDMGGGKYTVTITDLLTGELKATLDGTPNATKVTLKAGDRFLIDMGFPEGAIPDEVPTFNWTYSDVRLEVYK
ncbi:MAG TPA: hypothetical protein VE078_20335 [Thermoanaerobaculia bacterium]|nr:hypothetical protein [Thermoanaerobaculia bacterium]